MLKIKDNVDLKELEKYGFIKKQEFYIREYEGKSVFFQKFYIRVRNIPKCAFYKEIQDCGEDSLGVVCQNYENIGVENKIPDLIKDGLVEKV